MALGSCKKALEREIAGDINRTLGSITSSCPNVMPGLITVAGPSMGEFVVGDKITEVVFTNRADGEVSACTLGLLGADPKIAPEGLRVQPGDQDNDTKEDSCVLSGTPVKAMIATRYAMTMFSCSNFNEHDYTITIVDGSS